MKQYPEIPGPAGGHHKPCYAFYKYDGSNIRAEWSPKRGWYKFGTRHTMIDANDPVFGTSIPLFLQKYGETLPEVFKKDKLFRGVQNVIVFFEWFGADSVGGSHKPDDPHDVVLFDVNPHKKGFLGPKQFLDSFGHLPVAELVWQGNYGPWLVEAVRKEQIPIESKMIIHAPWPEGVVCKGIDGGHDRWACKIKTERYKELLKILYDAAWEKYWC